MRLLTITPEYPPAPCYSVGRYAYELNRALARQPNVEAHILCWHADGQPEHRQVDGVMTHRVDCTVPAHAPDETGSVVVKNVPLAGKACEILRGYGPFDFVCAHDWPGILAGRAAAFAFGVPVILFLHHTKVAECANRLTRDQLYVAEVEAWAGEGVRAVVAPSLAAQEDVAGTYRIPRRKITAIPCGVARESFTPREEWADFRSVLAEQDQAIVLFVGRLSAAKGVDVLIEAMSSVIEKHPEARLVFAGDGVLRPDLTRRTSELGVSTLFTGHIEGRALAAAYQCADMVVLPARYEPTGMAALEAMTCGKPLVVSDVGAFRELVAEGAGLRVPAGQPKPLADAISRILNEPETARGLGAAAMERSTAFTWDAAAERLLALANRLLGRATGGKSGIAWRKSGDAERGGGVGG